jgi:hypothetical protein
LRAPGAEGYRTVNLVIGSTPDVQLKPAVYPRPKLLYLPAIKERVPVFENIFRISEDVQLSTAADFNTSLGANGKTLTVAGKLEYQACDKTTCFPPTSVPVQWQLQVVPLDRTRVPEDLRRK